MPEVPSSQLGQSEELKEKLPEQETALDLNVLNLMRRNASTTGVAGQCLYLVVYRNVPNKWKTEIEKTYR